MRFTYLEPRPFLMPPCNDLRPDITELTDDCLVRGVNAPPPLLNIETGELNDESMTVVNEKITGAMRASKMLRGKF